MKTQEIDNLAMQVYYEHIGIRVTFGISVEKEDIIDALLAMHYETMEKVKQSLPDQDELERLIPWVDLSGGENEDLREGIRLGMQTLLDLITDNL